MKRELGKIMIEDVEFAYDSEKRVYQRWTRLL